MVEQSRPSPAHSRAEGIDALQRRVERRRSQHEAVARLASFEPQRIHEIRTRAQQMLSNISSRFILHTVVAITIPAAVALTQIQPGVIKPATPIVVSSTSGDFVVPVAPLAIDRSERIDDAPLDDGEIPVPLSLISRSEALAPVVVSGSITAEKAHLRNGPGTAYDVVDKLEAGAPLQIVGVAGDWLQVRDRIDSPMRWISAELVELPEGSFYTLFEVPASAIPAPPPPKVAMVSETGLTLRDGPGTNYVGLTKLDASVQLDLIENYQGWYHVGVPGGAEGWVKADFLTIQPGVVERITIAETIPDVNPTLVGTIIENKVSFRTGPDSRYPRLGTFAAGVTLDLIGKNGDWVQVRTESGKKAWVFGDFVRASSYVMRRVPTSKNYPALPVVARRGGGGAAARPGSSVNLAGVVASGDVAGLATQYVGYRYVWGASSPRVGFDCSGLMVYTYRQFGVSLPRTAASQFSTRVGASVGAMDNLKPGDLMFFVNTGGRRGISHVAMYIGGGRMVHAMTPRYGVQISGIYERYWVSHYYGGIRPYR